MLYFFSGVIVWCHGDRVRCIIDCIIINWTVNWLISCLLQIVNLRYVVGISFSIIFYRLRPLIIQNESNTQKALSY